MLQAACSQGLAEIGMRVHLPLPRLAALASPGHRRQPLTSLPCRGQLRNYLRTNVRPVSYLVVYRTTCGHGHAMREE